MILFGRSSVKLKSGNILVNCENCDSDQEFTYLINSDYFHLYYIPTFPVGKSVIIQCPFCKTIYQFLFGFYP